MIPARIEQFLKTMKEPEFFIAENSAACADIHDSVSQYVEGGTETLTINVDVDLLQQAEAVLKTYGWTLEEATVLFFMWCVTCPDEMDAWCAGICGGEAK